MTNFVAVTDTNVLVPPVLRGILLRAYTADLYQVRWSPGIFEELERTLIGQIGQDQARKVVSFLDSKFPEAMITEEYMAIADRMPNDPGDRHVLAAAIVSNSQVIITQNMKHFPESALGRFNVRAQTPDTFLCHLLDLNPLVARKIIMDQALAYSNPPMTVQEVLKRLELHAPTFVAQVRDSVWIKLKTQPILRLKPNKNKEPNTSAENRDQ